MGWAINSRQQEITHTSGMTITFDGDPESDNFSGSPCNMPKDLSAIELAGLIREGFDFYRKHSRGGYAKVEPQPAPKNPREKIETVPKTNRKPLLTLKTR